MENTEICTGVYSGVWRMMRHGWVYTVENTVTWMDVYSEA